MLLLLVLCIFHLRQVLYLLPLLALVQTQISAERLERLVAQQQQPLRHRVTEVAIVRCNQYCGIAHAVDVVLQPDNARKIQEIGRLVQ